MRKIFLILVVLILAVSVNACGEKMPEKEAESFIFPANVELQEIIKSDNWQLSVQKDNKTYTLHLDTQAQVFYNDKAVMKESLTNSQTLYIEGYSKDGLAFAQKLVITNWPGKTSKGPDVKLDPKSVPNKISAYLEQNRPELGVVDSTVWRQMKNPPKTPPGTVMEIYQNVNFLLVVKYEDGEKPKSFTVILTPSIESPALWSGRLETDGNISETLYENN
jgi:hypothetical protein